MAAMAFSAALMDGRSCTVIGKFRPSLLVSQCSYIVQQPGKRAVLRGTVKPAHTAAAVHQHEARTVHQAAIHVAQLEAVAANGFERRLFTGQENPAARRGTI